MVDGRYRGRITVPPRTKPASTVRVGVPAIVKSRLPENILKKELKAYQDNSQPMALPTIPIMQTVPAKPSKIANIELIKRDDNRQLVDASFGRLKDINSRSLLKLKDDNTNKQVIFEPNKQLLDIDKEPATKSVLARQNKNKSSKIIHHRQGILKQLSTLVVLISFVGLVGYVSYSFWDSEVDKNKGGVTVLGSNTTQTITNPKTVSLDGLKTKAYISLAEINLKDGQVSPGKAYYQQGILLVDYDSLAKLLTKESLIIISDSLKGELKYGFKNSWLVDSIESLPTIWPADDHLSIIAYNKSTDNWSIITIKLQNNK